MRHVHRVLHTALQHAVDWRLIPRNPADSVSARAAAHRELRTFSQEQATAFLDTCQSEGSQWHAFFAVAMTTGLRMDEMLATRERAS